jgi:hypothetical protein
MWQTVIMKREMKHEFGKFSLQEFFFPQVSKLTIKCNIKREMRLKPLETWTQKTKLTHALKLCCNYASTQTCTETLLQLCKHTNLESELKKLN